jgi:hypothetical protein
MNTPGQMSETRVRLRAGITALGPTVLLIGFAYHPYIGNATDETLLAEAAAADTTRWRLSHLAIGVGYALTTLSFIAFVASFVKRERNVGASWHSHSQSWPARCFRSSREWSSHVPRTGRVPSGRRRSGRTAVLAKPVTELGNENAIRASRLLPRSASAGRRPRESVPKTCPRRIVGPSRAISRMLKCACSSGSGGTAGPITWWSAGSISR